MANSMRILPDPLEVGQGFRVELKIDATEAKQGDKYTLVITDPTAPVVIDIHTDEIITRSGDPADLTFESVNGFQAIGHFTFVAVNESDPFNPIPSARVEFDVILPAPATAVPVVPAVVATPAPAVPTAPAVPSPATTPAPTQPSAWRFMSHALSWITAIVVVLAALVIGIGILGMPAWAVWLIAKNGSSQNGQPVSASANGAQVINPECKLGCSAFGNLYFPKQ